jgi:hypothetical protein
MDGSRSLKRPSDGESSGNSQRQKVEGHASGGFASGEAGRRSTRFMPIAHSQELHERRENSSFEVPASQQIGTEYLLELRGQIQQANQLLQDTYHQNQTVLEHLDQQVAKIQQDTRALENSFHPPARNEQSMPQHQQEEVFDIHDYLNLSSDSDDESDQRELLEAHEPARSTPIQSSIDRETGLHDANAPSDAQPRRAAVRAERFPQPNDARRQQKRARITQQDALASSRNQPLPMTREELRAHWEVLLQANVSSPQNPSDYLNLISLDHRPDLYMEQRDQTEGRKPFTSYLQKYEHEAFKSGRRLKTKNISETKLPLRERLVYMMYNRFRNIQKCTKYCYTDIQVQNEIDGIRCTEEYKEAFSGVHEGIIASLGNEGSSSQQVNQPSKLQFREGEKRRSDQALEGATPSKMPRFDSATYQDQLYEQQQSKGKELANTDQLKERLANTEKQFGQYPSWSHHLNDVINDITWENMGYQLDMGFREVLARQQEAGPSRQGDAPNKISPSDLNTHPDESHEQQQHDKGKSTMIPELKEYLMRSLAANPAPQTYIDNLSKYLSSLSKEDQIEYLRRSRAVDPAFDYFSRLSGKDKKAFHDFHEYINKAVKEAKMDRNVAIDVGKKWFPKGYQHYKQWQEKMRRSENTSGS